VVVANATWSAILVPVAQPQVGEAADPGHRVGAAGGHVDVGGQHRFCAGRRARLAHGDLVTAGGQAKVGRHGAVGDALERLRLDRVGGRAQIDVDGRGVGREVSEPDVAVAGCPGGRRKAGNQGQTCGDAAEAPDV
jgi:hypothetical protein